MGLLAHSTALLADASLTTGTFMLVFGLGVLAEAVYKTFVPVMPNAETMRVIGTLALLTNLFWLTLLYRHRADNLNMSSTWLCSRNDLIANAGVLMAAAASFLLVSRWPDLWLAA